jgi:hypothetical protein
VNNEQFTEDTRKNLLKSARAHVPQINFDKRIHDLSRYYSLLTRGTESKLLCSTFVELSTTKVVDRVIDNIMKSSNQCDWLVVVYGSDDQDEQSTTDDFYSKLNKARKNDSQLRRGRPIEHIMTAAVKLEFVLPREKLLDSVSALCKTHLTENMEITGLIDICDFSMLKVTDIAVDSPNGGAGSGQGTAISPSFTYNALISPKSLMLLQFLPYLRRYRSVWLLDGDISLRDFDMRRFLNILRCSFASTPLVSQPLIAENTQTYKYLNSKGWAKSRALSSTAGFVEIQAPLMDSRFLEWYLLAFVAPMAGASHILGADWGFDRLFCNAASTFIREVLLDVDYSPFSRVDERPAQTGSGSGAKQPPNSKHIGCAIVTGGTPLHHLNSQVTNSIMGSDSKYALNMELVALIAAAYPNHVMNGKGPLSDPLHPEAVFRQVYELRPNCEL